MAVVGSAYVEIRALSKKFNQDINKALQSSLRDTGRDMGERVGEDFATQYKKTVDEKLKKTELPVPETRGFIGRLRNLGREIDKYDSRVKRASRSSSSFAQRIKQLDGYLLSAFGAMVTFGGGFSGLMMKLDAAGAAIGGLLGLISALVSGLFAVASAAAPAAKSIGILPGLISALITPAIAASLALGGLGKAYSTGVAALRGGKEELKKYREELKKLNPDQAEFVKHLIKNRDALVKVKNAASEKIFDGLTIGLNRIIRNGFLEILADGLRDAGGALGYVAARVGALTGKTFFQRSFGRVMDSNVVIINNLGEAFVNLLGYLTLVADAARPFTEEFSKWIATITGNWLSRAQNNFGGLRKSIGDGVGVAKQLGDIFSNIWGLLGNIGRAARPAGQVLLDAFEGATAAFEKWTGQEKNQDRMEKFFLRVADTTRAIGRLLVSVSREFLKLGENPAFVSMLDTLATSTVPKLAESMDKLVSAAGDDLIGIFDTLADIGSIMADSGGLESYLTVMQGFLDVIKKILDIPGVASLAGTILGITGALKALSLVGKFTGISYLATTIIPALASKKTGAGAAAGQVGKLTNSLKTLSATAAPLLVITSALELLRTNPWTGTGENPGQGEGSFFPKAPKFLDDFVNNIGDPKSKDKEAIRGWFRKLFEGANINIPWDRIWEKSRLPEMGRNISRTFSQITGNIGSFFRGIPGFVSRMRGNVEDGLTRFRARVTDLFQSMGRGITNAWNNVTGWVGRAARNMRNGVENTLTRLRSGVTNIFRTIGRVASNIWSNITSTIGGFVNRIRRNVSSAFNGVRITITNIFNRVRRFFAEIWSNIYRTVGGWLNRLWDNIRRIFNRIRGTITAVWRAVSGFLGTMVGRIVRNTMDRFNDLRNGVVRVFTRMRQGVASAWARIRAAAREPVEYVVNTVFNNGLRRAFNTINNVIPGVPDIPPIRFGSGSKTGGSRPASDRGFYAGGHTGFGPKFKPAGIVHADEFVIKKESRQRIERTMPGLLDYMNMAGKLPGFASGGLVKAAQWWIAKGARASEHPAFGGVRGGHMRGSLHYSGNAVDLNYGPSGENATEKRFFDSNVRAFRSAFPGLGILWRVADHFNHMHIDTGGHSGIGKGGGGGLPSLGSLLGPLRGLTGKLNKGAGGGLLGDLLRGAGKRMLTGAVDLVKNKFAGMAESAGDFIGGIVGGAKTAGTKGIVRGLAATRGWGGGAQWNALDWLVSKESGWNPKAANPTSSARGLFQKMTSIHGPLEGSVAGQAQWGLNYIKNRYGNPVNAARFHRSHGYYAGGGRVAPVFDAGVFDTGGTLAPGMNLVNNKTGGFERLVRPEMYNPKGLAAEYRALTRVIERAFGASGRMVSAGAQVVAGLVNGMRAGASSVAKAAIDISGTAVSATESALDMHSPSKVFRGLGLNIVKGLVVGVQSGRQDLAKSLTDTMKRITDFAEDRIEQYGDDILEGYRRANKKIREYNKTHKIDKDILTPPTERQAEERAMKRLGYSKASINRARSLIKGLNDSTKKIWQGGSSMGTFRLLNRIETFKKTVDLFRKVSLGDLARGAEVLNSRLAKAQEKLNGFKESHKELSSSISGSISDTFSLSSSDNPAGITAAGLSSQAKTLAGKAKTLAGKLRALIKTGMPKALVQQIAGLGIDDAIKVSDAILAGTSAERRDLYKNFSSIDVNAKLVGDVVADQMYGVGLAAQEGLIKGLEADKKAVTDAAKRLAQRLEREVKRELGIKSPSKVFERLGEFVPLGLAVGVNNTASSAVTSVTDMATAVSNAFNPTPTSGATATLPRTTRSVTATEEVDANGLTAQTRAIIAAIQALDAGVQITINPPAEMDIFTLAKLVARELGFRGR